MNDDASDTFFRLQEELRRRLADGGAVDEAALAAEFGVSPDDVRRCRAALALLADAAWTASEPAQPHLPADYELLGELGRGGMGVVYRARQRSLDRQVAVKVLRGAGGLRGGLERFRKEARSLARLRHPHIVAIHEIGETDGAMFYSMDLVEGAPLSELIRAGSVTPTRAVHLLRQVASAVAFSHAHGVVHRDLKPANVLVDARGEAFVADFGLARDVAMSADVTASGQILGTPAYMSPEQALGQSARVGEQSDVYALGAILYECLTGRPPFAGDNLAEVVLAVVHQDPPRPRRLQPTVPRELEVVCAKAMAKRPEDRYATANAMLEDLERFHEGRPLRARPPSWRYRVARWLHRRWRPLAIGLAAAGLLLAGYAFLLAPRLHPPAAQSLAAARDLLAAEQPTAALVLLDKAATQDGGDRLRGDIDTTRVTARLALVDAAPADGGDVVWEDALAQLRRAAQLAESSVPDDADRVVAAAWRLAGKAARRGAGACVDGATDIVARVLAVRRLSQHPSLPGMLALAFGTPAPTAEVLEFLWPALREADDPLRLAAARVVSGVVSGGSRGGVVAAVVNRVQREPSLLVPLLEELDRVDAATASERFRPFLGTRAFGFLAPAWMQAAAVPHLLALAEQGGLASTSAGRAQAAAAELLAVAHDLPLRMRRDGDAAPEPDAARVAAIAALVRDRGRLARIDGYRREVACAVEALATAASAAESDFLSRWLEEHTQSDRPTGRAGPERAAAWRRWWEQHAADDPRAWLAARVGLDRVPAAGEAPALLARYLRAPSAERAAWHLLLSLTQGAAEGRLSPCRPWPGQEPDELPMQWWRALRDTAVEADRYVIRTACVRWRDGDAEPCITFQEQRLVALGETSQVAGEGRLPPGPITCASPRVPGVQAGESCARGTWSVRFPRWQVVWTPAGRVQLVADGDDAMWSATHPHVGHFGSSAGVYSHDEGEVAVLLRHDVEAWQDAGIDGSQVFCATFHRSEVEPTPWTMADWRAAVGRSAAGLDASAWLDANGNVRHGRVDAAARALELARWMPIPEMASDLARLTVGVPGFSPPGSDGLSRAVARARLLLGDAAVLDAPDFAARVPVVDADDLDADEDTRFWAHVWLRTDDARLRELAEARVRGAAVSPALAATMAASPTPPATEALRQVVAGGRSELWRRRFLPSRSIQAAALVACLASLVALVAVLRSRGRGAGASAMLLVAGVLVAAVQVWVSGVPVLPAAAGAAFASVAAVLLARRGRGPWRFVTPSAWAVAAVCEALADAGVHDLGLRPAAAVAWASGVLALPLLAGAFPVPAGRTRWLGRALALVLFGTYGVAAIRTLYADIGARLFLGVPARIVIGSPSWWAWREQWPALIGLAAALALVYLRATNQQSGVRHQQEGIATVA